MPKTLKNSKDISIILRWIEFNRVLLEEPCGFEWICWCCGGFWFLFFSELAGWFVFISDRRTDADCLAASAFRFSFSSFFWSRCFSFTFSSSLRRAICCTDLQNHFLIQCQHSAIAKKPRQFSNWILKEFFESLMKQSLLKRVPRWFFSIRTWWIFKDSSTEFKRSLIFKESHY